MRAKLLSPAVLAGCVVALAAGAAHAQLSPEYMSCHGRAHGSTVQEGLCAQKEMTTQDARLNKAYQELMRQVAKTPDRHAALRDEERSWLKKRDYDCKVDGQTIDNSCLVKRTAERADELEHQLKF